MTADHGIFEQVEKSDGTPSVGHTLNPVPFVLYGLGGEEEKIILRSGGKLCNVAPTILDIMGLPKPNISVAQSEVELQKTVIKHKIY